MFAPETWSVYERKLVGAEGNNNHIEAAHCRLQAEFDMDHPNIWKFIDGIPTVQKGCDFVYEQVICGDLPPAKHRKYIGADAQIKSIVDSYSQRNIRVPERKR